MRSPELREVRPLPQDHQTLGPHEVSWGQRMRPTVMGWGAVQNWITERRFVVDKNVKFPRTGAQCRNCAAVRPSPLPQPCQEAPAPWLLVPEFAGPFPGSSGLMFPVSTTRWQSLGAEAAARGLGQIRVLSPAGNLGRSSSRQAAVPPLANPTGDMFSPLTH